MERDTLDAIVAFVVILLLAVLLSWSLGCAASISWTIARGEAAGQTAPATQAASDHLEPASIRALLEGIGAAMRTAAGLPPAPEEVR